MNNRAETASAVSTYAMSEVMQFIDGTSHGFSTYEELGTMFNVGTTRVPYMLQTSGVLELRNNIRLEAGALSLPPSSELAWLVGYLSGSGSIQLANGKLGQIKLEEPVKGLREKFMTYAKTAFHATPTEKSSPQKSFPTIQISNRMTIPKLGLLSGGNFMPTSEQKYSWITESKKMSWKLIEGIMDSRSGLDNTGIRFSANRTDYMAFLQELFVKLGVDGAHSYMVNGQPNIIGVFNRKDLKLIALNTKSANPAKEAVLASYRTANVTSRIYGPTREPKNDCSHRWHLDQQNGPISMGMCKCCGGEKRFKNGFDEESVGFNPTLKH